MKTPSSLLEHHTLQPQYNRKDVRALVRMPHDGEWTWRPHLSCPTTVHGIEVRKTRRERERAQHTAYGRRHSTYRTHARTTRSITSIASAIIPRASRKRKDLITASSASHAWLASTTHIASSPHRHPFQFFTPSPKEPIATTPQTAPNLSFRTHKILDPTQLSHNRACHQQATHWQRVCWPVTSWFS